MSDSEEEIINYSKLIKRGRKDTPIDSRQALFQCIADKGTIPKAVSHGKLDPFPPHWTTITINKGTHLHSMGFTHQGKVKLHTEEAAYLIARNALVVENTDFERYCEMMYEAKDGFINYDKYQVYAYLKRLGFIVMRAAKEENIPSTQTLLRESIVDRVLHWLYSRNKNGPLVWDYKCRHYKSVYSTLRIIPSTTWYTPFTTNPSSSLRFPSFDFNVYKPRPTWKKKNPGVPDYKIVVSNVQEAIPTLQEQAHLFNQLSHTDTNQYAVLRNMDTRHTPTFIMALAADSEGVLFLRMTGTGLADISLG
ncbi:hypothetical protein K501DRAFT_286712 [Backusella circina FSU 941]|nr:hypothetical protein K501DRAFT_286712 [Backusella circina FSU 941]